VEPLKSPYPYFGGKARIAPAVWARFGNTPNYVEPFFGSGAVLLNRPHEPQTETVNDLDGWLVNFWRAIQKDPERVAAWVDYPVSELDLHARGDWLFYRPDVMDFVERMRSDPDYCNFKIAGWWVWGLCAWIGGAWGRRENGSRVYRRPPHLTSAQGVNRQLPSLGSNRGVYRKIPHLGDGGRRVHRGRAEHLEQYFGALSDRFREVRIACGDWSRVVTPAVTTYHGITAVFLDPPYGEGNADYTTGGNSDKRLTYDVRDWAIANGDNREMRIAFCGYEGMEMPETWTMLKWKAVGGYGNAGDGQARENAYRERVWFSPYCIKPDSGLLG